MDDQDDMYWMQMLSDLGTGEAITERDRESGRESESERDRDGDRDDSYLLLDLHRGSDVAASAVEEEDSLYQSQSQSKSPIQSQSQYGEGKLWIVGHEVERVSQSLEDVKEVQKMKKSSSGEAGIEDAKSEGEEESGVNGHSQLPSRAFNEGDSVSIIDNESDRGRGKEREVFPSVNKVLNIDRFSRLRKYAPPKKIDIWEDQYPATLQSVKDELIFHRVDIENTRCTESGDVVLESELPINSAEEFRVDLSSQEVEDQVRDDTSSNSWSQSNATLNYLRSSTASGLQVSTAIAQSIGDRATTLLSAIALQAIDKLTQSLTSNEVVCSVVGLVSESAAVLSDQADNFAVRYQKQTVDSAEEAHLDRIKRGANWVDILLRLSMGTIPYQQRQLVKETKNIHCIDEITARDKVKECLKQLGLQNDMDADEDDLNFLLARLFTAPDAIDALHCSICNKDFGMSCFHHHCSHCGNSVCNSHSRHRRRLLRFGIVQPVRVCDKCRIIIDDIHAMDELLWKDLRVQAFIVDELLPYPNTNRDLSMTRLAEHSLLVTKNTLTLTFPTKVVIDTIDVIQRNGLSGFAGLLLKRNVVESVETLKKIVIMDKIIHINPKELTACIYYKLAVERALRSRSSDVELMAHKIAKSRGEDSMGCFAAVDSDIAAAIRYAPLALNTIYQTSASDMQRMASLQELRLIFTNLENEHEAEVRYALFATIGEGNGGREAILVLRGLKTLESVVEDINSPPVNFPPSQQYVSACMSGDLRRSTKTDQQRDDGPLSSASASIDSWLSNHNKSSYACPNMVRIALQLLRDLGPSLLRLSQAQHRITVVGHSLGAAIASLLTLCLREVLPTVRCFAFAPPSCVDSFTSDRLAPLVTSIVLHDDVIPRITPQSTRKLLRDIAQFRNKIFRQKCQDWQTVVDRAIVLWTNSMDSSMLPLNDVVESETAVNGGDKEDIVMVEDAELTSLWIPGKILHIFVNRGQYRVAEVSRSLPTLRKIEVQGHMLDDHRGASLLNALLEVRAVRRAPVAPPIWESFSSLADCSCCKQKFTWHATFRGEESEYRERYNCRHCGNLVCGLCSTNQRAIPKYGLIFPRRICDQCELNGDYAAVC